jgi:HrpA-like helicases
LSLPLWNEAVEQWIARLNCLAEWRPELELPRIGEEERRFLCEQLAQGVTNYRALKDKDPWPVLRGWLSAGQLAALDAYAPEKIKLPGGRQARLVYAAGQAPVMAARVQDLYGGGSPAHRGGRRSTGAGGNSRPEPTSDPSDRRPGQLLEKHLPADPSGIRTAVSEARVAVKGGKAESGDLGGSLSEGRGMDSQPMIGGRTERGRSSLS